jgi:hypothetical protein
MIIAVSTSNFRINKFLKERPFIVLLKRLTEMAYRAIQILRLHASLTSASHGSEYSHLHVLTALSRGTDLYETIG